MKIRIKKSKSKNLIIFINFKLLHNKCRFKINDIDNLSMNIFNQK